MITEPKIEDRNEQHYVGIRTQVTMQEMGPVLPPLWGEVYGWLASKGLKSAGAPLWRYRIIDMEAKMEIDVGVPVATAVTGDGRVTADTIPAGRYATLIYPTTVSCGRPLICWLGQRKKASSGISGPRRPSIAPRKTSV
jgi:effector-binding domain-containing protein